MRSRFNYSLFFIIIPYALLINSICVTLFINIPVIVPIIILLHFYRDILYIHVYIYNNIKNFFKSCKIIPWITTTNGIPPRVT